MKAKKHTTKKQEQNNKIEKLTQNNQKQKLKNQTPKKMIQVVSYEKSKLRNRN